MNRDDKKRIGVRSLSLIALLLMAALLAACGGQSKPRPPPGSPERPLVAQTPQDASPGAPQRGHPGREGLGLPAARGEQRGHQQQGDQAERAHADPLLVVAISRFSLRRRTARRPRSSSS